MIDYILTLMEQIAENIIEAFTEALYGLADFGEYILNGLLYIVLILTLPIWIIPLTIRRRRKEKDRDDNFDHYTTVTR